jgi:hypothetical protein
MTTVRTSPDPWYARRRAAGVAGCLFGVIVACEEPDQAECREDAHCAPGAGCVFETCVPRLGSEPQAWSVEVAPASQSQFAPREFPEFSFADTPVSLSVDHKASLTVLLEIKDRTLVAGETPTSVHVVASVPSRIAGRGRLQVQGDASNAKVYEPYDLSLSIPAEWLGSSSRLSVVPRPPLDRAMPPWLLDVTLGPNATLAVPLPTTADTIVIEGRLESFAEMPESGYVARARRGDRLVSNVGETDQNGQFRLKVQKGLVGADLEGVSLELGPADGTKPLPILLVPRLDPSTPNLGTLRLPPPQSPETYQIPVIDAEKKQPVVGATVRFTTSLPGASGGEALYVRVGQTDASGIAAIPLIPGSGGKLREYTVKVVPPKDAPFAAHCVEAYGVAASRGGTPVFGASIELPRKVVLSGRILLADGRAARGLRLNATRQGELFEEKCGSELVSPPSGASTDSDGRFRLLLEPGEYRIEYEPPPGAPVPLYLEESVVVPDAAYREIHLPAPVLVEGRVISPDGAPVPDGEVRVFERGPSGRAQVRGLALSGPDGRFRLILPRRGQTH